MSFDQEKFRALMGDAAAILFTHHATVTERDEKSEHRWAGRNRRDRTPRDIQTHARRVESNSEDRREIEKIAILARQLSESGEDISSDPRNVLDRSVAVANELWPVMGTTYGPAVKEVYAVAREVGSFMVAQGYQALPVRPGGFVYRRA